jgi:WD40 repeat protein
LFDKITGQQRFKLTASDPSASDEFGHSVAISGNTAIIGTLYSRTAYLYDVTTGQERFKLTSDVAGRFGNAVAISGNTAIVAAPYSGSGAPSAHLIDATTGLELFKLTPPVPSNVFGGAVAIDGNRALVGDRNAVHVFDVTTGQEMLKLTVADLGPQDGFGEAVAIQGNLAVVTGYRSSPISSINPLWAYLFDISTGQELLRVSADGPTAWDAYRSNALAFRGNTIVVGAPYENGPSTSTAPWDWGAAHVFAVQGVPEPSAFVLVVLAAAGGGWRHRKTTRLRQVRRRVRDDAFVRSASSL